MNRADTVGACADTAVSAVAAPASTNPATSERSPSLRRVFVTDSPRERLLTRGAQALNDVELLAVWLGSGIAGCDVMELSRRLLSRFGSVRALLHSRQHEFCDLPGIGSARFAQFSAMVELCRRAVFETLERGDALTSPARVREYLALQLAGLEHEVFVGLFLDNRHRVIAYRELFTGTIDGAAVYPREVVKCCLAVNAAAVIFAHNHPSGVAEPSDADIAITQKLREALALVDVRVLDHLIVGDGQQTSLAERGVL